MRGGPDADILSEGNILQRPPSIRLGNIGCIVGVDPTPICTEQRASQFPQWM